MDDNEAVAESRMEAMVEATLAGHDSGPFEPPEVVSGDYQATFS